MDFQTNQSYAASSFWVVQSFLGLVLLLFLSECESVGQCSWKLRWNWTGLTGSSENVKVQVLFRPGPAALGSLENKTDNKTTTHLVSFLFAQCPAHFRYNTPPILGVKKDNIHFNHTGGLSHDLLNEDVIGENGKPDVLNWSSASFYLTSLRCTNHKALITVAQISSEGRKWRLLDFLY